MASRGLTSLAVVLVAGGSLVAQSPKGLVVVPVERGSGVEQIDAQVFYQGIITALTDIEGIEFRERSQLKTVLDEQDLALALGPEQANKSYSKGMKHFEFVLVPAICRLRSDYILSIRKVCVGQGLTVDCEVYKTRLASELAVGGRELVKKVVLAPTASGDREASPTTQPSRHDELRRACIAAKAQDRFAALWQRVEAMRDKAVPDGQLASYYYWLIQLNARAENPPQGMVFVPGGWVTWPGLSQKSGKRLWLEPFFMDCSEVSVRDYAQLCDSDEHPEVRRPITAGMAAFSDPVLPVTGVSFSSAEAFAKATGRRLPTALEWLRASDICKTSGRANVLGDQDGFSRLAPAREEASVVSGFGGNVREWTSTWKSKDLYSKSPGGVAREPRNGSVKLICGQSWRTPVSAGLVTSARPGEAFDDVGFRCVKSFFEH